MGDAEGGEDQHQGEGEFLEPKGQAVRGAWRCRWHGLRACFSAIHGISPAFIALNLSQKRHRVSFSAGRSVPCSRFANLTNLVAAATMDYGDVRR
jgi:hypothetical protein